MLVLGQIGRPAAAPAFGDACRISFAAALVAVWLSFVLPARGVRADPVAAMGH